MIRNVRIEDSKDIADIYNHYILNTCITFETEKLSSKDMEERIQKKINKEPWIVYEENNKVVGYAYVGEWRSKAAFNFTKEVSVYLGLEQKSKGIGTKLMEELINKCKECGIHTLISVVTVPNDISEALHEKFGFKKAGYFEEVGFKQEKWLDVVFWQLHI
jgi:phosphinothricin acetyltransferase